MLQSTRVANLVIPDAIWGRPVISIYQGAFRNAELTSVSISKSVTSIGDGAFLDNRLTSITMGENVNLSRAFPAGFENVYRQNGMMAATYAFTQGTWFCCAHAELALLAQS